MYIPNHFEMSNEKEIYDFIEENSFGILFSQKNGDIIGSHISFLLNRKDNILFGHVAIQNEHWKYFDESNCLAVFQGYHHYISPSWYETKNSVPTWNYQAVHVYGKVEVLNDQNKIIECLNKQVEKYETLDSSYKIDSSNIEYVNRLSRGITAFEIRIERLEGKSKLSQNHSIERRLNVITELEKINTENSVGIANLIRKNLE